jgi:hypothetical protein
MFEFQPWMISKFKTCEMVGYLNPNDYPDDDEFSIKRWDYWGHDHDKDNVFDFELRGGRHSDANAFKKDYSMLTPNNISEYMRKFHGKIESGAH